MVCDDVAVIDAGRGGLLMAAILARRTAGPPTRAPLQTGGWSGSSSSGAPVSSERRFGEGT